MRSNKEYIEERQKLKEIFLKKKYLEKKKEY